MGGGAAPARPGAPRKGAIMKDMGRRQVLPVLGDEEIARGRPTGDEPGAGTLVTERGNLPLEALGVHARITGLLAEVVLTQTFVNRFDLPLQATYVFPLPDRAAVTEFRMEAGDRVVEGALRERAEARAAYDEALVAGRMAAIAEEERPGVFTMRVGNLPPGERASVRLVVLGPLPYDQGEATFRFPLVVAPRYIPGAPLGWLPAGDGVQPDTDAVPDASRITPPVLLPGFPSPVRLDLRAEVDPAGLPLGEIRSSLHAIVRSEREGPGGRVRVVQAERGERLDRDFVLRLQVGSGRARPAGRGRHLRAHGDATAGGGGAAQGRRAGAGPLWQHGGLEDRGRSAGGRPPGGQPVRARPPDPAGVRRRPPAPVRSRGRGPAARERPRAVPRGRVPGPARRPRRHRDGGPADRGARPARPARGRPRPDPGAGHRRAGRQRGPDPAAAGSPARRRARLRGRHRYRRERGLPAPAGDRGRWRLRAGRVRGPAG